MTTPTIRFDDGAAYEEFMGKWSQLAGTAFLDWLAPAKNLHWLDVGCGNGAFTELIVERCRPASVDGIDPSEAQVAFARQRFPADVARFRVGDALAQPFLDDAFDVAVMPLVIFFVPDPPRGVAEMARVVRAGGSVTAYGWDLENGGFPYESLRVALESMGVEVPKPPHPEAAGMESLRALWKGAGLEAIETREIRVQRTFSGFDEYWSVVSKGPSVGGKLGALSETEKKALQTKVRAQLSADGSGKITCHGRANAVRGRVPH